jgi:hypothetical protein
MVGRSIFYICKINHIKKILMKKFLFTLSTSLLLASSLLSQTPAPTQTSNFDKKFRFGLRITPQPTWLSSADKNNVPSGAKFGFGFGLNMEFKFSEIAALQTGIGGDFEGGKYTFRNDPGSNYQVMYFLDASNNMIAPKNGSDPTVLRNENNTGYVLKDRSVQTTFVTIPLILKLSTKEYNAFKYFGMFGGELGVRVKAQSTDSYYNSYNYNAGGVVKTTTGPSSQSQIDISKDASPIPLRFGLNVGAGTEYRIAGSTSVFASINYFRSFVNVFRQNSNYLIYKTDAVTSNGTENYKFVQQSLLLSAIRINIGIMF